MSHASVAQKVAITAGCENPEIAFRFVRFDCECDGTASILARYGEDDVDQWTDARTALSSYVTESRARFVMGEVDP